jgi:hypothetical protein
MKTLRIHQSISLLVVLASTAVAQNTAPAPSRTEINVQTQPAQGQTQIGVQTQPGQAQIGAQTTATTTFQAQGPTLLKVGQVQIKDTVGQPIGSVEDVVISPQGCVDMALLSVGGGTKLVAIPWQLVRTETTTTGIAGAAPTFTVSVDRTRLLQAPSIERAQIQTQISQPMFSQQVHTFFGVQAGAQGSFGAAGGTTTDQFGATGTNTFGRTNMFPTGRTNQFRSGAGFGRTNDFRQPGTSPVTPGQPRSGLGTPTQPGTASTTPPSPTSPNTPGSAPNTP